MTGVSHRLSTWSMVRCSDRSRRPASPNCGTHTHVAVSPLPATPREVILRLAWGRLPRLQAWASALSASPDSGLNVAPALSQGPAWGSCGYLLGRALDLVTSKSAQWTLSTSWVLVRIVGRSMSHLYPVCVLGVEGLVAPAPLLNLLR